MKTLLVLSIAFNVIFVVFAVWLFLLGGFIKMIMSPFTERQISQFEVLGTKQNDIVFLGDSLIAEGKWDELFSTPILNRGIPGDTAETLLSRVDQVSNGHPKKVFLMVGINDIAMRKSEKDIVSGVVRIVEKIHQDSPQTEIFVFSILPNKPSFKEVIESTNIQIEKSISEKADWINLYPTFIDKTSGGIKSEFSNDGAHLLGKGYQEWKNTMKNFIE